MAISVTFSLDEATVLKLRQISQYGKNSEKIRELIAHEWDRLFKDGESAHAPVMSVHVESIPVGEQP